MMNQTQLIETLKKEAQNDKIMDAVLTDFGSRERTRYRLTLRSLVRRMEAGGFNYPEGDYVHVLKKLANIGIGKIETTATGRVKALGEITYDLPTVGKVVKNKESEIKTFKPRHKFQKIEGITEDGHGEVGPTFKAQTPVISRTAVSIVIKVGNKPIELSIPDNLTTEEIAALVAKLKR